MGEAPRARNAAQNTLTTWQADRLHGAMVILFKPFHPVLRNTHNHSVKLLEFGQGSSDAGEEVTEFPEVIPTLVERRRLDEITLLLEGLVSHRH
jgi:hypothetical protein